MKLFDLAISTPDGAAFEGEAAGLSVRGAEGDLKIMADHAPFATSLQPCQCRIDLPEGNIRTGKVDGGLLIVADNKATLLSGSFEWENN